MKAWFISDIHLKDINERNGNVLLRFLNWLSEPENKPTHLFLLGDIFDMWLGRQMFYYKRFKPIVDAIIKLQKSGTEVIYFEGNHDLHIKKFWEYLGVRCFIDQQYFELGNIRIRVEHGDLINLEDKAYLRYRNFARKPAIEMIADIVPARALHEFGKAFSRISRKFSSQKRRDNEQELRSMIRVHGERSYKEKPFDYIISGHMHVRDEYKFEVGNKTVTSINLGSWFEEPAALLIDDRGFQWKKLD